MAPATLLRASQMALRSSGNSQRAVMSNLGGTVFAVFQDGAIKGLNVAQMIRSLTSGTLSGWQEGKEQTTDLAQLSASFRVDKGQATTTDLNLIGPLVKMTGAGTIDLAAKALAFRVEPKLVLTTEGQGRTKDVRVGSQLIDPELMAQYYRGSFAGTIFRCVEQAAQQGFRAYQREEAAGHYSRAGG